MDELRTTKNIEQEAPAGDSEGFRNGFRAALQEAIHQTLVATLPSFSERPEGPRIISALLKMLETDIEATIEDEVQARSPTEKKVAELMSHCLSFDAPPDIDSSEQSFSEKTQVRRTTLETTEPDKYDDTRADDRPKPLLEPSLDNAK